METIEQKTAERATLRDQLDTWTEGDLPMRGDLYKGIAALDIDLQGLQAEHCAACGFVLSWHVLTGAKAKKARSYCPARQASTWATGYRKEWVPNVRAGGIIDRGVISPTFQGAAVRNLHRALGNLA